MNEVLIVEKGGGITIEQVSNPIEVVVNKPIMVVEPEGFVWVRNGKKEIEQYVNNVSKPDIDEFSEIKKNEMSDYVEKKINPEMENYAQNVLKPSLSDYVENVSKPTIDVYVGDVKPELDDLVKQAVKGADDAKSFAISAGGYAQLAGGSATSAANSAASALEQANRAEGYAESINPELLAKKDLTNTGLITNCILEAPNGVATYGGSNVTVKAGLKVLVPNGRNADGTLNNIVQTLPSDKTSTTSFLTGVKENIMLVNTNWDVLIVENIRFFVSETQPTSDISSLWYNPKTNMYKRRVNTGGVWNDFFGCAIAKANNSGSTITSLTPELPVELLKVGQAMDKTGDNANWSQASKILFTGLSVPDLSKGVTRSTGTTYTANVDGFVYCSYSSFGSNFPARYLNVNGVNFFISPSSGAGAIPVFGSVFINVGAGSSYKCDHSLDFFLFYPSKGGL